MNVADIVTEHDIAQYLANGVVCLHQVISADWIESLTAGVERNIENPSERGRVWNRDDTGRVTFYDSQVWRTIPEYRDFVLNSPMAELAGRVMGVSAVNFFFDAIFTRATGSQFRPRFIRTSRIGRSRGSTPVRRGCRWYRWKSAVRWSS